jgi:MFS family permease
MSFIAQIFGGIGAGANCTASMAILSSFESEEREMYIGYIEAANGVGLLFGPLFGAALYSFGGYTAPFLTFSCLYLVAYPYIYLSFDKCKSQIERSTVDESTINQS